MNIKRSLSIVAALVAAMTLSALAVVPAFAQTSSANSGNSLGNHPAWGQNAGFRGHMGDGSMMKLGVVGKVASVSGTSLTVTGRQGFGSTTATVTFNIDGSNAVVKKNNATSSVASIAVGDMVAIAGTVSGTNVTATMIRDGMMMPRGGSGTNGNGKTGQPVSPITGNGQPVVAGTVSAVSGNTITITNKSNIQYSVDATNAKIVQGQNTVTIGNIATGDNVIVQGAVNNTSITATSVIDMKAKAPGAQGGSNATSQPVGIFGRIGQFFSHLFGF